MKIVCDNCGTKYSIADEKVQGKVFKIRCKKCQHIIVVRGTQVSVEAVDSSRDQPSGSNKSDSPIWHVVVGGQQVGPIPSSELRDRFARGEINADTYTWREGFSDWIRLNAVEDFADLVQVTTVAHVDGVSGWDKGETADWEQQSAQESWKKETAQENPAELAQRSELDSADLFASRPEKHAESNRVVVATEKKQADANLFAGVDGGQNLFPDENSGLEEAPVRMTGQRGENSVLFSLANLQALAMGGEKSPRAVSDSILPNTTSSGGSGLIDIRELAAGTTSKAKSRTDDELPTIAPISAVPVLMPTSLSERPAWIVPVIGGAIAVMLVAIGVLVFFLMKKPQVEPQTIARLTPPSHAGAAKKKSEVPTESLSKKGEGAVEATAPSKDTKDSLSGQSVDKTDEKNIQRPGKKDRRRPGSKKHASKEPLLPSVGESPKSPKSSKTVSQRKGNDSLDDLIDGALSKKKQKGSESTPKTQEEPKTNLPKTLEKSEIQGGIRLVKNTVQGCYDKYKVPGLVLVTITIGNNGKISKANVTGRFSGTPTGACVENAVKRAKFPKFSGSPITISYPFDLR